MDDVIVLDHTVELYVATQCICGRKLPEDLRDTVAKDVKKQFNKWFNASSVQHGVEGSWTLPDGTLAEENVDIVYSKCDRETLESIADEVKGFAVAVADRLSQDRVSLVIDGTMLLYPRSRTDVPCVHEARKLAEPTEHDLAEAVRAASPAARVDRLKAIHALVQRDWSEDSGLEAARDLFCGLLGYEYAGGHLPCYKWPDKLSGHIAGPPMILADANGFKVVYLQLSREKLLRVPEREVIARILHDDPSFRGVFVVSDKARKQWELVNAKVSSESVRGLILRRLQIGVADGGRTTTERLAILDITGEDKLDAAAIQQRHDNAFDVEAVTKGFYKDYVAVFEQVEALLPKELDAENRRRFAQTLFNRLMFLRFVERKGWMEFGGRVRYDYLHALYKAGQNEKKSFYRNRLRRLFFEGLSKEKDQPADVIGKVPFLNGGLFEETPLDKKVKNVPEEAFEPLIGANGLLYRYNFTVTESTPVDVEVAVDPEMLGRVFEGLVNARHESGSYYTPRPIVAFMCREALKGYLLDKTDCPPDAVSSLVDEHDVKGITPVAAGQVVDALEHLKAVDPACGSGAYLLGLLQEMISLYQLLFREELVTDPRSLYDLKLHVISHNLYGVDIDPLAVNIAMLRLWLSLIVEFEGGNPPSLPNLDFKIECGDSLLGPDPQITDLFLVQFFEAQAAGLQKLKDKYMKAHGENKEVLRQSIQKQQNRIEKQLAPARQGAMHWCLQFAEVFGERRGFDIVLANPPYVRQELISAIKPQLKETYPKIYAGTADLYCYFYARAIELLRDKGMLVFISSNKWFRAGYGENLRQHIADSCNVLSITDFGDLPVFESATAYPMIFVAKKKTGNEEEDAARASLEPTRFTRVESLNPPYPDVLAIIRTEGDAIPEDALRGKNWTIAKGKTAARLAQMEQTGVRLSEYVDNQIYYGIKTGFNKAFIIDGVKRAELIAEDPGSADLIKPLALGKDIRKWRIEQKDRWLIFTRHGTSIDEYPAVKRHLMRWRENLEPRPRDWPSGEEWNGRKPGPYKWYEIQDNVAYYQEFDRLKIVYPVIGKGPCFAFDDSGACTNDKAFIIPVDDLFLLGVLNSSPFWEMIRNMCSPLRGGFWELRSVHLGEMPIPIPEPRRKKRVELLVRKCLESREKSKADLEQEIDEIVAGLYGL
ncbi:MAG TPA: Eco57I restriction-modification methylase domain-containing protein [Candidatus Hydrogenedentes bacterium]|nr:Eco57I restriction-modification methylase domain-containing protein [Candidatus Hydrogenedentota bacterium]HQM51174.1 Eco57I restriction-modification methylase domain-containing protein [Candidatus Hydrogenedentota bacterium]